jgi:hypothetical protein
MDDVEDQMHPVVFLVLNSSISAVAFRHDAPPTAPELRFKGQSEFPFPTSQKVVPPPGK